jgi:hypothetical protein
MTNFRLINPYIRGKFKNHFEGNTAEDAAEAVWNKLSKYIMNNIPQFAFSIERISDNKLFHFSLKEKLKKGSVDYTLELLDVKNKDNLIKGFKNKVSKFQIMDKKYGGAKNKYNDLDIELDDLDGSDEDLYDLDDSDDLPDLDGHGEVITSLYSLTPSPIMFFYYTPLIYPINSVFIPTFSAPILPYVEIDLSPEALM